MASTAQVPALLPALPEMILAGGAMLLLMLGAYRGERSGPVVALGAIMLLLAGIGAIVVAARRQDRHLRRQLHPR